MSRTTKELTEALALMKTVNEPFVSGVIIPELKTALIEYCNQEIIAILSPPKEEPKPEPRKETIKKKK